MKPWLKNLHVLLAIGGGYTGIVLTSQFLFGVKMETPVFHLLIMLFFIGLYAYCIFAGFRFWQNESSRHILVCYWLQAFWISSPVIAYRFTCGFQFSLGILDGGLNWLLHLGSQWTFYLGRPLTWGAGVNAFALVMIASLVDRRPVSPPLPPSRSDGFQ